MSTIAVILTFLIKTLSVLFFAGLFVGLAIIAKRAVFSKEDIQKMKNAFTKQDKVSKVQCTACGKEQSPEWKVCPFCGSENLVNNL